MNIFFEGFSIQQFIRLAKIQMLIPFVFDGNTYEPIVRIGVNVSIVSWVGGSWLVFVVCECE